MKINCYNCHIEYDISPSRLDLYNKHYCSAKCKYEAEKIFNPDMDEFKKDLWKHPITVLSDMYGVSVKTIHKFCNIHELDRPGRGYWQKKEAGVI